MTLASGARLGRDGERRAPFEQRLPVGSLLDCLPLFPRNLGLPKNPAQQIDTDLLPVGIWYGDPDLPPHHVGMLAPVQRALETQGVQFPNELFPRDRPEPSHEPRLAPAPAARFHPEPESASLFAGSERASLREYRAESAGILPGFCPWPKRPGIPGSLRKTARDRRSSRNALCASPRRDIAISCRRPPGSSVQRSPRRRENDDAC